MLNAQVSKNRIVPGSSAIQTLRTPARNAARRPTTDGSSATWVRSSPSYYNLGEAARGPRVRQLMQIGSHSGIRNALKSIASFSKECI